MLTQHKRQHTICLNNVLRKKQKQKNTRIPPDGCTWVCMGAAGCRGTEGQGNNGGRAPDGIVGHVLQCISTTKKCRMLSRMIVETREDHGGGNGDKFGGFGYARK